MPTPQEIAQKQFDKDDRAWNAHKLFGLGAVTLFIAISAIFLMSYTLSDCTLTIVP
jgi:hypothetical protein